MLHQQNERVTYAAQLYDKIFEYISWYDVEKRTATACMYHFQVKLHTSQVATTMSACEHQIN